MNVRRPANYALYKHPFSSTQETPCATSRHHPRFKLLPLPVTYLLLHRGIHCTHISLGILEFLNQAMVALLVFSSKHPSVCFLDFLQTNHISAKDKKGWRRGAYLDLLVNALSVQVHRYTPSGLFNARLVPFHDPTRKFFARIGVHGHAIIAVAGITGIV